MSGSLVAPGNPFHINAPDYGQIRPAYPAQCVDDLLALTGVSSSVRVVDVGAGTGKLSVMFAQRGADVVAVEPSESMLAQMPSHPRISTVVATGEETSLADSCADLVTFAQSWHWVDPDLAGMEAARISTDDGVLALLWNQMDVSCPWVHRLSRIMRSGDVHRPDRPPALPPVWSEPVLWRQDWNELVTPEDLLRLGRTRSSYLRQDEDGRGRMRRNLEWYVFEHLGFAPGQPLLLPYMTLVWVSRKRPRPSSN